MIYRYCTWYQYPLIPEYQYAYPEPAKQTRLDHTSRASATDRLTQGLDGDVLALLLVGEDDNSQVGVRLQDPQRLAAFLLLLVFGTVMFLS